MRSAQMHNINLHTFNNDDVHAKFIIFMNEICVKLCECGYFWF